jgi:hypothetical protein
MGIGALLILAIVRRRDVATIVAGEQQPAMAAA